MVFRACRDGPAQARLIACAANWTYAAGHGLRPENPRDPSAAGPQSSRIPRRTRREFDIRRLDPGQCPRTSRRHRRRGGDARHRGAVEPARQAQRGQGCGRGGDGCGRQRTLAVIRHEHRRRIDHHRHRAGVSAAGQGRIRRGRHRPIAHQADRWPCPGRAHPARRRVL